MSKGSSPTFMIHMNGIEFDGSEKIWVAIQQNALRMPVVVTGKNLDVEGSDIYVFVNERETGRMTRGKATVQVKVQEDDGYIWFSPIKLIEVKEVIGFE